MENGGAQWTADLDPKHCLSVIQACLKLTERFTKSSPEGEISVENGGAQWTAEHGAVTPLGRLGRTWHWLPYLLLLPVILREGNKSGSGILICF